MMYVVRWSGSRDRILILHPVTPFKLVKQGTADNISETVQGRDIHVVAMED